MKKILYSFILAFMLVFTLAPSFAYAKNGVGGYNSYRGKKYVFEEFDTLRERLKKDGYFKIGYDDNPLKDTSFCYGYLLDEYNAQFYEVWIDDDDYDDYTSATMSGDISEGLGLIERNCVIIGWYEYREVDDENPTGKMNDDIPPDWETGTVQFVCKMKKGLKGDVSVVLFESERKEYYTLTLHDENNWEEINVFPKGHYFISNIYYSDEYRPVYDEDLGMDGEGFQVYGGCSKIIYAGFGTEDIPNASWKKDEKVKLTEQGAPTNTPNPTATPAPADEPVFRDMTEKENSKAFIYIMWGVIIGIVAVGALLFIEYRKKGNSDDEI